MKVTLPVPERAAKSIKLQQYFRKPPNTEKFEDAITTLPENIQNVSGTSKAILDCSLEVLDGSFSELRPIGSSRTGPQYASTPKDEDTLEEGELTTPEPQCSPISKCKDIRPPAEDESSATEPPHTPVPKYEDISGAEEEDDKNLSFNFQTDIVQENERSDSYILEVESFIVKSSEVLRQKTKKRDELFRKRDKYLRKAKRVEEAIRKVSAIVVLATKFTDILE